jgi:hypothetical protein
VYVRKYGNEQIEKKDIDKQHVECKQNMSCSCSGNKIWAAIASNYSYVKEQMKFSALFNDLTVKFFSLVVRIGI